MTKTQLHNNVTDAVTQFLTDNKIAKTKQEALMTIIDQHLKPRTAGTMNPPILDNEGYIIEAYCRYHQQYEKVDDMVMSKGKSKGYCKAGISIWNRNNKKIKDNQALSSDALENDNLEDAKKYAKVAKDLKSILNLPSTFNYELDWKGFNA